MRKYRNGLCAIIQSEMEKSSLSRNLFIFTNKKRDIIRFLYWDDTGFAIWSKTLDRQKYRWPKNLFQGPALGILSSELTLLLQGMDISSHKKLEYQNTF